MSQQANNPDFSGTLPWGQVWIRVLTQPSESTIQAILADPTAGSGRAYRWMAATALIELAISSIVLIPSLLQLIGSTSSRATPFSTLGSGWIMALCLIPLVPALAVLGLIINAAVTQFIASTLGGNGSYEQLAYAFAAYLAPLGLLSTVLNMTPVAICLTLPLSIYGLVLHVTAVKGVNQFSWGKAILASFLIPILLIIGVVILFSTFIHYRR